MTAHKLTLTDELSISEELARASNNMKTGLNDSITISEVLDSTYKIIRIGDTAFARTHIY